MIDEVTKEKNQIFTIPNAITLFRIIGTVFLPFVKPVSPLFFVIYTLCGMSDVLDGCIARATNTTSSFGSKMDSVADILFYAVMLLRLFPILWECMPRWIWLWIAGIVFIRMVSYVVAAVKYHRLASLHTYLNKATGFCVFLIPYFLPFSFIVVFCSLCCAIATVASLDELIMHLRKKTNR